MIASAWSDHHDLFRYVRRTDSWLRHLDSVWLLTIILNPFATKLLLVSGQTLDTDALRFGFYALLQLLESAMVYAMLRHLISHRLADIPPQVAKKQAADSRDLMLGFALSIPLFLVTTYAWLLWFLTPQLAGRLRQRLTPEPPHPLRHLTTGPPDPGGLIPRVRHIADVSCAQERRR